MDDRPYYYRLRGRTLGPVGLRQIRQLAQRAQIGKNTDVSRDGVQWAKAGDHPEIFDTVDTAPQFPTGGGLSLGSAPAIGDLSLGPALGASTLDSSNWYYAIAGIQKGPVDLATLRRMVASGQLASTDQVFPEGGTAWVAVSQVPDLAAGSAPGGGPVINVTVPQQSSEGTNGLAIAGFVLSLIGCAPLGLILSLVALNSPNKANRGLAIAGAIIGGLLTLCGCGYFVAVIVVAAANS